MTPMGDSDAAGGAAEVRLSRDEMASRDRAAFLAGESDDDEQPAAKPAAKKPAPKQDADEDEGDDADESSDADEDADEDDDAEETSDDDSEDEDSDDEDESGADDDDDDDEDSKAKKDPELDKRLEQVRRAETRFRQQMAKDRAEFERVIESWKPRVEAAERFEKLRSRVKYETADVLVELGLSEDDFEDAARDIFARSKKGAADPKNREAVARSRRERELQDRLDKVQKQLDERAEAEKQQAAAQAAEQETAKYLRKIEKSISEAKHPLAARLVAKNSEKARAKLGQVALSLAELNDEMPTPLEVLEEYERIRREELDELGVDPATIKATAKSTTKTNTTRADAKTTVGTKTGKAKKPAGSQLPSKDEILAELEAGDFD